MTLSLASVEEESVLAAFGEEESEEINFLTLIKVL